MFQVCIYKRYDHYLLTEFLPSPPYCGNHYHGHGSRCPVKLTELFNYFPYSCFPFAAMFGYRTLSLKSEIGNESIVITA